MPRVEHVQLVAPADIPRFAALGIAAQPALMSMAQSIRQRLARALAVLEKA